MKAPNKLPAVDAAIPLPVQIAHHWRGPAEAERLPVNEDKRTAPANVANEPRACSQRGDVPSPNPPGTPGNGPLVGAAERIGSRRFANGRAVHRQTRRMEPPGHATAHVCPSGHQFPLRTSSFSKSHLSCGSVWERFSRLFSDLSSKRVDDIEEFGGAGGGISHQRLDLAFSLWGDPVPRIFITIYDDGAFSLRVLHPYVSLDGRLPALSPPDVASLIEQTLHAAPKGAEDVRKLWEVTHAV